MYDLRPRCCIHFENTSAIGGVCLDCHSGTVVHCLLCHHICSTVVLRDAITRWHHYYYCCKIHGNYSSVVCFLLSSSSLVTVPCYWPLTLSVLYPVLYPVLCHLCFLLIVTVGKPENFCEDQSQLFSCPAHAMCKVQRDPTSAIWPCFAL